MIEVGLIGLVLVAIIGKFINSGPAELSPVFVNVKEEK